MDLRRQSLAEHLAEWRRLLGVNNFGWLWVGQVLSQIGDGVSKVALLYFVYDLTDSALQMTVIGILETIPPLVLGAFAGVYLDRIPKKAAMIGIDVARGGLADNDSPASRIWTTDADGAVRPRVYNRAV